MYRKSICNQLYLLIILTVTFADFSAALVKVSSYYGIVAAENVTRYKCSVSGNLRLVLNTIQGDADLYITEGNLKADYENYDLNSATCGQDYIDVPASMLRPLSISVYGHPTFDNSTYELMTSIHALSDEDNFEAPTEKIYGEDEEPAILMILKFILEFMFEVLF